MDDILERGSARFFVRPRVMLSEARGFRDVQRLFVVLSPAERRTHRRVVIGKKRMASRAHHEKEWAYVDRVGESMAEVLRDLAAEAYDTKTEGFRTQAGPQEIARGSYRIRTHGDHVHLDYELEGSPRLADVGLEPHASFIATVMNPLARWRPRTRQLLLALDGETEDGPREPSIYDDDLQEKFADKKYAPLDPAFLDHVGCEIVLIGVDRHEARIVKTHGRRSEQAAGLRPRRRRAGA